MALSSKTRHQYIVILSLLLGLVLIFFPEVTLTVIIIAIGGILIMSSVMSFIEYYRLREGGLHPSVTMLLTAVTSVVAGCVLIVSPLFFVGFMLIIISLLLSVGSITQLIMLYMSKREGFIVPIFLYFLPISLLILSITMLVAPITSATTIITLFGYGVILYSVMDLLTLYLKKRLNK